MPSVRALAVEAGVNPNTMQKALADLESQGLLNTRRASGRTVTEDERLIMRLKDQTSTGYVEHYFAQMQDLGIERSAAAALAMERVDTNLTSATTTTEPAPASNIPEVN